MFRIVSISLLVILFFIAACELRCENNPPPKILDGEFIRVNCKNTTKEQPEFCGLVWTMVSKWKQGLWKSKNPWLHWASIEIRVELSPHKPEARIEIYVPDGKNLNSSVEKKKSALLSARTIFQELLGFVDANLMEFSLQTGPLQ